MYKRAFGSGVNFFPGRVKKPLGNKELQCGSADSCKLHSGLGYTVIFSHYLICYPSESICSTLKIICQPMKQWMQETITGSDLYGFCFDASVLLSFYAPAKCYMSALFFLTRWSSHCWRHMATAKSHAVHWSPIQPLPRMWSPVPSRDPTLSVLKKRRKESSEITKHQSFNTRAGSIQIYKCPT